MVEVRKCKDCKWDKMCLVAWKSKKVVDCFEANKPKLKRELLADKIAKVIDKRLNRLLSWLNKK